VRRKIVETFARAVIEILLHAPDILIGNRSKVGSFREEVPDQPVPVFIRTPLPGMVRIGPVHRHADPALQHCVLLPELGSAIVSVSVPLLFRNVPELPLKRLVHCRHAHRAKPRDAAVPAFSLNAGGQPFELVLADDRIAFPVADPPAGFHHGGSGVNALNFTLIPVLLAFFGSPLAPVLSFCPDPAELCLELRRLAEWMAAVSLQSIAGYRGLLARAGFAGIEAEDLSAEWIGILRERLRMYQALRGDTVARFGQARYDEYNQLYAFFVKLVEAGKLGGARFSARSAPTGP